MKYISTTTWRDLQDGHLYAAGDPFPHDGREIAAARLADLSTAHNKAGYALIKGIPEPEQPKPKAEPVSAPAPEKPEAKKPASKTGSKTTGKKTAAKK